MKAAAEGSWGPGYTINGAIVRMFENVAHFRQKEQERILNANPPALEKACEHNPDIS